MQRMNELAFYALAGAPKTPRDLIDEVRMSWASGPLSSRNGST